MKWIKEFRSFELNEGVFDKVKGWFKGDEEEPGQPKQISNDEWREKLREYGVRTLGKCSNWTSGGIVPFTKKEIDFLEKWKLKGNDKSKLYTWDKIKAELDINYKIKITKLDDNCYLIYFDDIPAGDINTICRRKGLDEASLEEEYTKCFICDRWEEVAEYLKNVKYMFNTFSPHSDPTNYNVKRQYN